jgi:hypothetical protein
MRSWSRNAFVLFCILASIAVLAHERHGKISARSRRENSRAWRRCPGNSLQDIRQMTGVTFVMKAGVVYKP